MSEYQKGEQWEMIVCGLEGPPPRAPVAMEVR
jgi:hypothetical protein